MASEDTIYMDGNIQNESNIAAQQPVNNEGKSFSWKTVSIGGVSGILLGAGAVYAANAYAQQDQGTEAQNTEEKESFHTLDNGLKVADVSEDLSFKEAFDLARSEVGAGGVFHWHGNTYSTYNDSEWNALSDADKTQYAELVRPEITSEEIGQAVITDPTSEVAEAAHPEQQPQEVHIHHHYHQAPQTAATGTAASQEAHSSANYAQASSQPQTGNEDVQVVASGTVDGHQAVAIDLTGNGEPDIMIVDTNDNEKLDDHDLVVDRKGNMATVGQLAQEGAGADYASSTQGNNAQHESDDDVQVIARGTVAGHEAVALDLSSNGEADVVVIDTNDNRQLDNPDVVVDTEGNMATVGELAQDAQEDSYVNCTNMDNPDMSSENEMDSSMPDPIDSPELILV